MTSKERVRAALSRTEPDRVPVDYSANPGIDARLKTHFGLEPDDGEGLLRALGVDFRGVGAPYRGPRLHEDVPERGVKVDNWGIHRRRVEHDTGGYWDYCDFPLGGATVDEVEAWPMPSPDDHDYSGVTDACARHREYAVYVGGAGLGCIINSAGFLRGMEQVLVDLATDDPAGLRLIDRRLEIESEVARRVIEAARGGVDFMWMGEDLGTQEGPLIGMELFKRHIRPRHQRFIDLAKAHGLPVMIHTCGSSSWAYDEYIDMGVDAVDTLQPEAKDMAPAYLICIPVSSLGCVAGCRCGANRRPAPEAQASVRVPPRPVGARFPSKFRGLAR
ncbi:MAG: uroporphyrinogen decarboxylase family protein, partial [Planctomycetota bacterium]